MTAISIGNPIQFFTDKTGQPLKNGFIYIGTVGLEPVANPASVFWDSDLSQSASQPLRTLNGYVNNAGSPARFYTGSDYSIKVLDSFGRVVFLSLNNNSGSGSSASRQDGDGSQLIFNVSSTPTMIFINGVYQNQNTYTTSAGSVTFTEAPPVNSVIEFVF